MSVWEIFVIFWFCIIDRDLSNGVDIMSKYNLTIFPDSDIKLMFSIFALDHDLYINVMFVGWILKNYTDNFLFFILKNRGSESICSVTFENNFISIILTTMTLRRLVGRKGIFTAPCPFKFKLHLLSTELILFFLAIQI